MKTRTEEEMLGLIAGFAEGDERIRAVLMNGSRTNPKAERDVFQDYDVDYYVTDVAPFRDEGFVVPRFGETILVEKPENHTYSPGVGDGRYNFNIQLADGNRIDLTFYPIEKLKENLGDSLDRVLLDKDGRVPELPPPSERSHFIKPPTAQTYADCCEAFLFCLGSHIPKTFWRRKLPLLQAYLGYLRQDLTTMLQWEIGTRKGYAVVVGSGGKHLEKHLEAEVWEEFKRTYAGADYDEIWESLLACHRLFTRAAQAVALHHDFRFPAKESEKVLSFLKHVRDLPPDAKTIY